MKSVGINDPEIPVKLLSSQRNINELLSIYKQLPRYFTRIHNTIKVDWFYVSISVTVNNPPVIPPQLIVLCSLSVDKGRVQYLFWINKFLLFKFQLMRYQLEVLLA